MTSIKHLDLLCSPTTLRLGLMLESPLFNEPPSCWELAHCITWPKNEMEKNSRSPLSLSYYQNSYHLVNLPFIITREPERGQKKK